MDSLSAWRLIKYPSPHSFYLSNPFHSIKAGALHARLWNPLDSSATSALRRSWLSPLESSGLISYFSSKKKLAPSRACGANGESCVGWGASFRMCDVFSTYTRDTWPENKVTKQKCFLSSLHLVTCWQSVCFPFQNFGFCWSKSSFSREGGVHQGAHNGPIKSETQAIPWSGWFLTLLNQQAKQPLKWGW